MVQASALAGLTAAVSEMCCCGDGMNHFEPFSLVRGITQSCISPRKLLQGVIWVLLCRQPDRSVCCRARSKR